MPDLGTEIGREGEPEEIKQGDFVMLDNEAFNDTELRLRWTAAEGLFDGPFLVEKINPNNGMALLSNKEGRKINCGVESLIKTDLKF